MEIIIGRDAATSKLRIAAGKNEIFAGKDGSVPFSVCSQHCKLTTTTRGMRLINLDINADTFVNGQGIESKIVTESDRIELGADHYLLNWSDILSVVVDIRPLSTIWNDYEMQRVKLQIAERRFNAIRSATGIITMIAIVLGVILGKQSILLIVLYLIAILVSLLFHFVAWKNASAIPQKTQQLNRQFQRDYVCPQCGRFMGNQSYDILVQNNHCPHCKRQFIQ